MAEPALSQQSRSLRAPAASPLRPGEELVALGPLRITRDTRTRSLTLTLSADATDDLHRALERCRDVRERVGGFAGLVVFREGLEPGCYSIHTRLLAHAGQMSELGWSLERRLEMFMHVARSVQGLHEVGEVMGVLSPQHVLLNAGHLPHVLGPGVVVDESRAYQAPESRAAGETSIASDIYCLGALLHFLASDQDPACLEPTSELPSWHAVAHRGLRRIVRKACAPRPEDRYENVYELLFDLTRRDDPSGVGIGHPADGNRREASGPRRLPEGLPLADPAFAAE